MAADGDIVDVGAKWIAFTSDRDGNADIHIMDTDGRNQENLTRHPAEDLAAAWPPDGKRIAFLSDRGGRWGIWTVRPNGRDLREAFPNLRHRGGLDWSLDGKLLIFDHENDIHTALSAGGRLRNLTDTPTWNLSPAWSPDGASIVFATDRGEVNERLYLMDADGGNQREFTDHPNGTPRQRGRRTAGQ